MVPARRRRRDDDSLLIRSAESLGRVIGSLQRQMRDRTKRVATMTEKAIAALPEVPRPGAPTRRATARPKKARPAKPAAPSAARKNARTRKTARARKPAGARTSSKKR